MTPAHQQRPLTFADAPDWAALLQACEAVDDTGEHVDVDDARHELAAPDLDLARDTLGIVVDDRLVARAQLRLREDVLNLTGGVHPAHRRTGLGSALLDWGTARAAELGAASVHVLGLDTDVGLAALARGRGGRPVRHWFDMQRDLVEPAPVAATVGTLLTPDPVPHEELRLAHAAAFAGHWGSTPPSEQRWAQWFTGAPYFRPPASVLLRAPDGSLLGYALGYEYDADTEATGVRELYLGQIGVLPGHRARGAGTALLVEVVRRARSLGYARVALNVDSANGTGAVGLYERAGFVVRRAATTWALPVT